MPNGSDSESKPKQESTQPPLPVPNERPVSPKTDDNLASEQINVIVNIPTEIRPIEWFQFGINAALALIGIVAICIYGRELGAMIESNGINRDALTSVQRAFVNVGKTMQVNPVVIPGQDEIQEFEFRPTIENSGVTPTRNARNHANFVPLDGPLPENFPYADIGDFAEIPFILGPKEGTTGPLLEVPSGALKDVRDKKKKLYFYGWVSYEDIFPKTPKHISMFCLELTEVRGELKPNTQAQLSWVLCPRHNCADDECKGEPYGTPAKIWQSQ